MIIPRAVLAAAATLLLTFGPLAPATASEADEVVGVQPSAPQSPDPGSGSYRERVTEQLEQIESVPRSTPGTGGPERGAGSDAVVKDSDLPDAVVSLWPSPGAELMFPNRESRISFKERVDSRTFQGRILDAASRQVALGIDGSPALFTRSTITATEALDVIGTYPALGPGSYVLEWSVVTLKGERLTGEVAFTQLEPIVAPGGGNHRHGVLRIPFEQELTSLARGLIVFSFALLFRRRGEGALLPASLALAGAIHLTAFLVTASDTILTTGELLGRLDGWAAAGVGASAVIAALGRSRAERAAAVGLAAVAALSTTYIPNLELSLPVTVLLALTMYSAGRWAAAVLGWARTGVTGWLLHGAAAALLPAGTVVLVAGSLTPERGLGDDLRSRLLGAAVVLAVTAVTLAAQRLSPGNRYLRIPFGVAVAVVAVCAGALSAAPALL